MVGEQSDLTVTWDTDHYEPELVETNILCLFPMVTCDDIKHLLPLVLSNSNLARYLPHAMDEHSGNRNKQNH